ncbi:probable flavin-containing monoamine oxidase A [Megalops cyprinoides]|uniref:probable flavin-containing monoamine oxidase A n=1 Tax=Megalops cyprinoides TaxID=118141 RepID=UPI001863CEA7|nr:probable flavin-containing monoamine oxidase A [Megalops cyprinoides]
MWDVVIVGAGLSGLSAAQQLQKRDAQLKILVLDGKDRVGGRTLTSKVPAAGGEDQWDFGGQWVGSTQTHVMDLIRELGLEIYPQYTAGKKVQHMGGPGAKVRTYTTSIPSCSPLVLLDMTLFLWKIDRLCKAVSVDDPTSIPDAREYDGMTLQSYMERHIWTHELKQQMGLCSRTLFGMEPSQLSFLYFLMFAAAAGGILPLLEATPGSAQEFKVKGGTQQLSERLAEQIGRENILLGSAVTAIEQGGDTAQVRTGSSTYTCRAVIVTSPPHLAAKILYTPALPTEREKLTQSMPVGHMMKFIITYPTAFWREKGFSGEIVAQPSEECPFSVTFDATSPAGNPALVGFIAGEQALDWSTRTEEERRDAVISSLQRYLGPEAFTFIHYAEKDWAREDFSQGGPVNIMAPGMLTYYHRSLRRPCGRIYWAGTETATRWCGYMSGAVQSGQRAALEVLARLSPDSLSQEELDITSASRNRLGPCRTWVSKSALPLLRMCVLVTTATLAVTFLLAHPRASRHLIGWGLTLLQRTGLRQ